MEAWCVVSLLLHDEQNTEEQALTCHIWAPWWIIWRLLLDLRDRRRYRLLQLLYELSEQITGGSFYTTPTSSSGLLDSEYVTDLLLSPCYPPL